MPDGSGWIRWRRRLGHDLGAVRCLHLPPKEPFPRGSCPATGTAPRDQPAVNGWGAGVRGAGGVRLRYPQRLLDGGEPLPHFPDRGLAQGPHALLHGRGLELPGGTATEYHPTEIVGQGHDLIDGHASPVTRVLAFGASRAVIPLDVTHLFHRPERRGERARPQRRPSLALLAHPAQQPLGRHHGNGRGDEVGLHAHVGEAIDAGRRIVGMERGQHQMTRQRGVDGDTGGFGVTDLPHHEDIGVLAQERPQAGGEREGRSPHGSGPG